MPGVFSSGPPPKVALQFIDEKQGRFVELLPQPAPEKLHASIAHNSSRIMNPDLPLSDEELDELDRFLISDGTPEECMDIAMLDGFFTGLAIGPTAILPSQWLPAVWGETEDDPMAFESAEQTQRIVNLVMRMYNDRIQDLQEGIDDYVPLIYQSEHEGRTVPIIDEWCMGFIRAIELDPEGWQPLVEADPEEEGGLLAPMLLYGTEEGWDQLKENKALVDKHQDFADAIGPCVIGIRDYWLPHRKSASTFHRETAKVGRNDLCPCGSGKKYKKCCGSAEKLH